MRERSAVAEAHERVDDRGRLDRNLDAVVRHAEQEVRLDQLEALVCERRRVDRDLPPHPPGRMRECLLRRDVFQVGARAAPKWPAGAGQDERVDLVGGATLEALEECGVLAVDGEDPATATLLRRESER